MLGKSFLDCVPFCVVWWIVRKICEAPSGGFVLLRWLLCERGPVARHLDVIPNDTGEERDGSEDAECTEEVDGDFQVSPWNNRLNGV